MSVRAKMAAARTESGWGFERVICGVDDSPEGLEAVSQAAMLAGPKSKIAAIAVHDRGLAMHAGIHAREAERDLRTRAERALVRAQTTCPRASVHLLTGREASSLMRSAEDAQADLVAVGSHGSSRVAGLALGSVATAVIHRAPCSVLVARPSDAVPFPESILVATDGSYDARCAVSVAGQIASRFGSRVALLRVGDAESAYAVAEDAARIVELTNAEPWIEVREGSPKREIERFAAQSAASLVVVGSRGLGGARSLGSVSERVAHCAPSSVLIVRSHLAHHAQEDSP